LFEDEVECVFESFKASFTIASLLIHANPFIPFISKINAFNFVLDVDSLTTWIKQPFSSFWFSFS